jgi:hypothetical protein
VAQHAAAAAAPQVRTSVLLGYTLLFLALFQSVISVSPPGPARCPARPAARPGPAQGWPTAPPRLELPAARSPRPLSTRRPRSSQRMQPTSPPPAPAAAAAARAPTDPGCPHPTAPQLAIAIGTVGLAAYVATKVIGLERISSWIQDNLGGPVGPLKGSGSGRPGGAQRGGAQRRQPGPGPYQEQQWAQQGFNYQPGQQPYDPYDPYQQRQQQYGGYQEPQQEQERWRPPRPQPGQPGQQQRGGRRPDDVVDVYFEDDWGR